MYVRPKSVVGKIFSYYQHKDYCLILLQQLGPRDGCHLTRQKLMNVFPSKVMNETLRVTYLAYRNC